MLFVGLVAAVNILYRVALPRPLPSHRLLYGSVLAALVFLVATLGLRVYLTWITGTGYTYGALATPIAFLLFAFFLGFALMTGAELNAAIQEEWPAPDTHAKRLRGWWEDKADERNGRHDAAEASAVRLTDEALAEAPGWPPPRTPGWWTATTACSASPTSTSWMAAPCPPRGRPTRR